MYRFIVALLQPFTLLLLGVLLVTVALWLTRRPRGRWLIGLTVLLGLLTLVCFPPLAYLALGSLEWSYPPLEKLPPDVDTIVVLSGAIRVYDSEGEDVELSSDSAFRCLLAAKLYRDADGCRVVVSGGKVKPTDPGPTLGKAMYDFLVKLGVEEADLLTEEKSTTTYENAFYTRRLLERHGVGRIALVTDAAHMFRASRCFRALGIEVVPAACNHKATRFDFEPGDLLPSANAAGDVQSAFHEWLGALWYWMHGRI